MLQVTKFEYYNSLDTKIRILYRAHKTTITYKVPTFVSKALCYLIFVTFVNYREFLTSALLEVLVTFLLQFDKFFFHHCTLDFCSDQIKFTKDKEYDYANLCSTIK